jgi:hypothetical protein
MPKLTNIGTKSRCHKQSGQAIVAVNGRDFLLGPWRSKASRIKYDRLIFEWLSRDRQPLFDTRSDLTIAEVASRYWSYASKKHVRGGKPKAKYFKIKTAMRHLLRLYPDHAAAEYAPPHLKVVRQSMIDAGWARTYVNLPVGFIVRMFKWAACDVLIPFCRARLTTPTADRACHPTAEMPSCMPEALQAANSATGLVPNQYVVRFRVIQDLWKGACPLCPKCRVLVRRNDSREKTCCSLRNERLGYKRRADKSRRHTGSAFALRSTTINRRKRL